MRKIRKLFRILLDKIKCLFGKSSVFATIVGSRVDKTAVLRRGVRFYGSSIGRYSYVTRNCLIQNTEIGSFCSISEDCILGLPGHPVDMVSTSPVFLKGRNYLKKNFASIPYSESVKTVIGSDVWIGARAMVKGGVTIGHGAVIGAGAMVTKDVPPYAIVAGMPAKLIRYRFPEEDISRLLESRWWELSEEELSQKAPSMADVQTFFDDEVKK